MQNNLGSTIASVLCVSATLLGCGSRAGLPHVPLHPEHPLLGSKIAAVEKDSLLEEQLDLPAICRELGTFPEDLSDARAEGLWRDLAKQWETRSSGANPTFEVAYAGAMRNLEKDISRLLRQKRQYKTAQRLQRYMTRLGRWSHLHEELSFLTHALVTDESCHPAIYALLMSYWLRRLDPLAFAQVSQDQMSVLEDDDDGLVHAEKLERSFGTAWIVDGRIGPDEVSALVEHLRRDLSENEDPSGVRPVQWVWDLSSGIPSEQVQRVLSLGLEGISIVSWVWGKSDGLETWMSSHPPYYRAPEVCEWNSGKIRVVAACEPTRASRIEGQDPNQDLWLAVFAKERARRYDLNH